MNPAVRVARFLLDEEREWVWLRLGKVRQRLRSAWYNNIYDSQGLSFRVPSSARHAGPHAPGNAIRWVPTLQIGGVSKPALFAHAPSRVLFQLAVPQPAHFRVFVGLLPEAWEVNRGGVEFVVEVKKASGSALMLASKRLQPARSPQHRRWVEISVPLRASVGSEIELMLSTNVPQGASEDFAWAVWGDPVLLLRKTGTEIRSGLTNLAFGTSRSLLAPVSKNLSPTESAVRPTNGVAGRVGGGDAAAPRSESGVSVLRRKACQSFVVYTNSKGNYFFNEIRDLLAAGLREIGFDVEVQNEDSAFATDADWHVIVAPHEFFYLGAGQSFEGADLPENLILVNTEQPSSQWFTRAQPFFSKATAVWDINQPSAQHIASLGINAAYLPLGYVPDFQLLQERKNLPLNYGTRFLEPEFLQRSFLNEPLENRPIDILFLGYLSPRRDKFFAEAASALAPFRCYFYFWDARTPIISGENTYMDTETAVGLAQRSKMVLNLHHGEDVYFEWHRIVMHGIWQRALVVSETCGDSEPFEPERDFIAAPLDQIPELVAHHLSPSALRTVSQRIADRGFQTLTENCRLASALRNLVLQLYVPRSNHRFWPPIVGEQLEMRTVNGQSALRRSSL